MPVCTASVLAALLGCSALYKDRMSAAHGLNWRANNCRCQSSVQIQSEAPKSEQRVMLPTNLDNHTPVCRKTVCNLWKWKWIWGGSTWQMPNVMRNPYEILCTDPDKEQISPGAPSPPGRLQPGPRWSCPDSPCSWLWRCPPACRWPRPDPPWQRKQRSSRYALLLFLNFYKQDKSMNLLIASLMFSSTSN